MKKLFIAVLAVVILVSVGQTSLADRKRHVDMNRQEKILNKKREDRLEAIEKAKKCAECSGDKECEKKLKCGEDSETE